MKRYCFAILLLVICSEAKAQIMVVENPVPATSFAEATIKLDSKQSVTWDVTPEPTKIVENGGTIYFNGPAGKYKVTATVFWIEADAVKTKKHRQDVTIGSNPDPPTPPDPITPVDDFTKAVQAAYNKDADADKATNVKKLAALYKVAGTTTINDQAIKTNGQLFDTMKTASRTMLPDTGIPLVRRVIGDRLNPIAGSASSPVDRTKLAAEFKAIAASLETIK